MNLTSPCHNILGSLDDLPPHLVRPDLAAVASCIRRDGHLEKQVKTVEVKDIEIFHLLVGQVIVEEKEALGSQLGDHLEMEN